MVQSLPVVGSHCRPVGLRRPDAKTRLPPVAVSTSSTAARRYSTSMPFSVILLFEPLPTYSFLPSGLASSALVQWWFTVLGRSPSSTPGSDIRVSPGVYLYFMMLPVL